MCGALAPLVKSHVVPQALHMDAQEWGGLTECMRIYTDTLTYTPRSPTGTYDRIVCGGCEELFQEWDDYGVAFIREHRPGTAKKLFQVEGPNLIRIEHHDYAALKLFVMAMLWRADASNQLIFRRIDLGDRWRGELAKAILMRDPGPPAFFAITASLFQNDLLKQTMSDPHPQRIHGINHVRFYTYGGFTFIIKVDQRESPDFLKRFILTPGQAFPVVLRDLAPGEKRGLINALSKHDL